MNVSKSMLSGIHFFAALVIFSEARAGDLGAKHNAPGALERPFGQSAALIGGGTAANADLSTVDHNPAGIGTAKTLSFEGATSWKGNNIQSSEFGVVDSAMSSVAAAAKFRQTSAAGGFMERRFSIGLADRVAASGFLVGIAGDYKERPVLNEENQIKDKGTAYDLRGGALYQVSDALRVGVRSGGHLDKDVDAEHAIGVAALLGPHFVLSADQIFSNEEATKTVAGAGVVFNKYFDLRASYGFHQQSKRQEAGGGLFLVSPKAAVFYVANLPEIREPAIEHQIGIRLHMAF